jgi:hypothetical protein
MFSSATTPLSRSCSHRSGNDLGNSTGMLLNCGRSVAGHRTIGVERDLIERGAD